MKVVKNFNLAPNIMAAQTTWAKVKLRNYCLWMIFYHKIKMEQESDYVLRTDSQEEC